MFDFIEQTCNIHLLQEQALPNTKMEKRENSAREVHSI